MDVGKFSDRKNDELITIYPHVNVKETEDFDFKIVCCFTYMRMKGQDGNWYLNLLLDSLAEPEFYSMCQMFQRLVKNIEKKKLFCPMDENYIDKVNQASEVSNFVNLPMILIDDVHGDISEEERIKKIM